MLWCPWICSSSVSSNTSDLPRSKRLVRVALPAGLSAQRKPSRLCSVVLTRRTRKVWGTSFPTSYLQDRTQHVFLKGRYSTEGKVKCGIPQGSLLGPFLFCIFIKDLPLNITNDSVVCERLADDNSIHSCGSDLQSVQTFLQKGLNDVSLIKQNT